MPLKKLNVLLLFWGRKGGGARYTLEIARELRKREDVRLFLSVSNQCDLIEDFKELNCPGLFLDTYETVGGFVKKWVFQRRLFRRDLLHFLKLNSIDSIIIGMDFFWGDIIYSAARTAGAMTVYVVHEPKPHPGEPLVMSFIKKRTLKTLITGADHLVTLTEHVKKFVRSEYNSDGSDITVIPHGVFSYYEAEEPKKLPETESEPVVILYFGAITYYKGLDILLEAFALLEKQIQRPVKLEVWGSGDISKYRDLIDKLENIHIENRWIDESEVGELFRRAHICVLPYRDVSQSGILGAAGRAGLPVVACPAKGLKEQAGGDNVMYSKDFSPVALASEIQSLITDKERYRVVSEEMLEASKKLDWSNIAQEFRDILQEKNK
jgi:glycosyltransferase involved in cell wall biosynthesis